MFKGAFMTNPINYQNPQNPAYSGVTINITNPTMNAGNPPHYCNSAGCTHPVHYPNSYYQTNPIVDKFHGENTNRMNAGLITADGQNLALPARVDNAFYNPTSIADLRTVDGSMNQSQAQNVPQALYSQPPLNNGTYQQQAYPPQYYLNNYNYISEKPSSTVEKLPYANNRAEDNIVPQNAVQEAKSVEAGSYAQAPLFDKTNGFDDFSNLEDIDNAERMNKSKEIVEMVNQKIQEEKELEKKGEKIRVVSLTDEYIMSLENYLNEPKEELRIIGATEVVNRLGEDKSRYDDAALNALLNKMLQDPCSKVRILALSALAAQLASGNNYTVTLLQQIQNNPQANPDDVMAAADILLKMAANTEIRYTTPKQPAVSQSKAQPKVTSVVKVKNSQ